jgi:hypothetical protein
LERFRNEFRFVGVARIQESKSPLFEIAVHDFSHTLLVVH